MMKPRRVARRMLGRDRVASAKLGRLLEPRTFIAAKLQLDFSGPSIF
jgi:hypothetical protein